LCIRIIISSQSKGVFSSLSWTISFNFIRTGFGFSYRGDLGSVDFLLQKKEREKQIYSGFFLTIVKENFIKT